MNNLLSTLNNNFSVGYCGSFVNDLHQAVEHVIICDKAYSIRQQDTDLFEVLSSEVVDRDLNPYMPTTTVKWTTASNLTTDEVVAYFAKKSEVYLHDRLSNPVLANHVVEQ